jgi:DNA-binding NarL/FixJ family response regulator
VRVSGRPRRAGQDIAIVDVQLPDVDGFEVTEEIGGLGLNVQVILTSSLDGADLGALVIDSPAAGFVAKAELSSVAIEVLLVPAR